MFAAGIVEKRTSENRQWPDRRRETNPVSFHSLRYNSTSALKSAGVSDSVAMDIVGHETASICRNYTRIDDAAKRPPSTNCRKSRNESNTPKRFYRNRGMLSRMAVTVSCQRIAAEKTCEANRVCAGRIGSAAKVGRDKAKDEFERLMTALDSKYQTELRNVRRRVTNRFTNHHPLMSFSGWPTIRLNVSAGWQ